MMTFKRILPALLVCMASVLVSSCGYHLGSMMHPQVKSIAVAPVKNETKEILLAGSMRDQLCEQYQVDGSLKLKSLSTADCIIYTEVKSATVVATRSSSYDGDRTYRPDEFKATVTVEYVIMIPGRSEPLLPKRTVTGSASFQTLADPNNARFYGMRQACYEAARMIVQYSTEAW